MKIAFLVNRFPKLSETFILNQITGLIDRGHEVDIFAYGPEPGERAHGDVERYGLMARTHYYGVAIPGKRGQLLSTSARLINRHVRTSPGVLLKTLNPIRLGSFSSCVSVLFKLQAFAGRGPYDILQCHFGPNGTLGVLLRESGAASGKVVTTFHGYDIRLGASSGGAVYRRLFSKGDVFLSISSYNRENLIGFGLDRKKIVEHPVGIDLRSFASKWDGPHDPHAGPVRIITVARLVKEKGLEFGIGAVQRALRQNPGIRLEYEIIGEGPLREELEALTNKMGIHGSVRFPGAKERSDVAAALRRSDIFLLPSRAEALPVVAMEAAASGLPSVATSAGSTAEIVLDRKTGFCVPPGSAETLADRLGILIRNPQLWRDMGMAARRHVASKYDIELLNDRLVSLYQQVCGNRRATA